MTMTSEELRIKITLDDTGVVQKATRLEHSLEGIGHAAKNVSGSTSSVTASFLELQNSMESIRNLEIIEFIQDNAQAIDDFGASIRRSTEYVKNSMEMLTTSVAMINPFSNHYKDVEWEGFGKAIGDIREHLKLARDEGKKFGKDVSSAFRKLREDTVNLRAAMKLLMIAMIPIAGVMASFNASALGKEIYNTAQRVGMGTAAYQQWNYILQQTGADITDLIGAQQTLTEAQLDVAGGAEDMIDAFKRIGLSAEEVMAMDRQELFERTIAGLQNIENSTERAAVGYRLLSEDASTLAALLGMSNEQTRQLADNYQYLGAIMSEELIAKSLRFQGALSNLRAAFQGLVNTLAEIFLPVITTVVNALTKAIAIVNMFLRTLFGLELTTSESGTNSSVGAGINGFGAMTDNIEEANGAAKELRRTLMGFDELNVLDGTTGSAGGASGAGTSGGGIGDIGGGGLANVGGGLFNPENLNLDGWHDAFAKWEGIIQTVVPIAMIGIGAVGAVWCLLHGNWVGALAFATMAGIGLAAADSAGTWGQLANFFEQYNLSIIPIAIIGLGAVGAVMCALRGNWVGAMAFAVMAGIGVMTVSAGDGFSLNEIKGVFEELKNYAIPIILLAGAVMAGMRGNLPVAAALLAGAGLAGYLTWTGGGSLWDGLVKVVDGILPELKKYAIPIIALAGAIAAALMGNIPAAGVLLGIAAVTNFMTFSTNGGVWDSLLTTLKGVWENIVRWFKESVGPKFTKEYWATKFNTIKEGLSTKLGEARTTVMNGWNNIATYFKTNVAPKFTASYWLTKFDSIKQGISTKLGEARVSVINGWNSIKSYFGEHVAPKFTKQYWANKFDTIKQGISTKLGEARTAVMNGWNSIRNYFNSNIKPKFTASYWKGIFDNVKEGGRSAFNGLISIVEKAINSIVSKLNTVKFEIPDWVPKFGGKSFGISLKTVSIPRLAKGGIATSSTLANIGENGREAVLPLDHNTQWMDALADKIAARNSTPSKIVLKVGEKELGWASINGINQITRQTGELQLVL